MSRRLSFIRKTLKRVTEDPSALVLKCFSPFKHIVNMTLMRLLAEGNLPLNPLHGNDIITMAHNVWECGLPPALGPFADTCCTSASVGMGCFSFLRQTPRVPSTWLTHNVTTSLASTSLCYEVKHAGKDVL